MAPLLLLVSNRDRALRSGRMDSTNHRHVTRVATSARAWAMPSVLLLVLSACAVSHRTALDRVPLTPPSDHILAGRLATADVVVAGVLTRAQRDIRYEAPPRDLGPHPRPGGRTPALHTGLPARAGDARGPLVSPPRARRPP